MKKKISSFVQKIILCFAGLFLLVSCAPKNETYFYVLPHHNLTDANTKVEYEKIAQKYPDIQNIVIISPNHFEPRDGVTFPKKWTYCYQNTCVQWAKLEHPDFLDFSTTQKKNQFHIIEHGVGNHFKFIKKYFSKATVFPLLLRINTDFQNETLADFLHNYPFKWNTLVIASVDFSHHTHEKVAKLHDIKTLDFLKNQNQNQKKQETEVDCPNCLVLLKNLATKQQKPNFHFFKRTSVDSILQTNSNFENTSHIFWTFSKQKQNKKHSILSSFQTKKIDYNGESFSFVFVPKIQNKASLQCFYSHKTLKRPPKFWHNRLLFGIDRTFTQKNTDISDSLYQELGFTDFDTAFFTEKNITIPQKENAFTVGYLEKNILYYDFIQYTLDEKNTILCDSFQ